MEFPLAALLEVPPILLLIFPPDALFAELYILLFVTALPLGVPAEILDMPGRVGYWILSLLRGLKLMAKEVEE